MSPNIPLKIALDLRAISVSGWSHRRLLGLVRELDKRADCVSLELMADPVQELVRYPWSLGNQIVRPCVRTHAQVMHFLTGDVWRHPICKTVVSLDDPAPLRFPEICFMGKEEETSYWNHLRLVSRVADWVVTDSQSARKEILNIHPQLLEKLTVIAPGVDPAFFPEPWGVEDRSHFRWNIGLERGFFLHTGGVDVLSGLDFLLDAFRLYRKMDSIPRKLVITGDPHRPRRGMPTLHELVIQHGLLGEVILVGHVSETFLRRLYCSAALLVHPAKGGRHGYAPLEAMACGCPVLCSDANVLLDRVGQGAVVIAVHDPEVWARGMVDLIEDRDLRVDLVGKGLERAKGFSWEHTAREMIKVYQQAAQSG